MCQLQLRSCTDDMSFNIYLMWYQTNIHIQHTGTNRRTYTWIYTDRHTISLLFQPQLSFTIQSLIFSSFKLCSKKIFYITFWIYMQNVVTYIIMIMCFYQVYILCTAPFLLCSCNLCKLILINICFDHLMQITSRNAFLEHLEELTFPNLSRSQGFPRWGHGGAPPSYNVSWKPPYQNRCPPWGAPPT